MGVVAACVGVCVEIQSQHDALALQPPVLALQPPVLALPRAACAVMVSLVACTLSVVTLSVVTLPLLLPAPETATNSNLPLQHMRLHRPYHSAVVHP